MPTPLEFEINRLLRHSGDATEVASELVRRWRHHLLSHAEQVDCAQFLLSSGQLGLLLSEIRRLIKESSELPWAQLSEALGRTGIKPDIFELDALFAAADAQNALPELLRSRQLDLHSRVFSVRRAELEAHKSRDILERKQGLKDKINFMRAQRMFDQELNLLDEMEALFPTEGNLRQEKEDLRLRWAREVVAQAGRSRLDRNGRGVAGGRIATLSSEPSEIIEAESLLVQRAQELAGEYSSAAYDLAISLQMMECPIGALSILEQADQSSRVEWLRLELLVEAGHFVTVLDEATRLEEKYHEATDTAFASTYARARALFGLGEKPAAVELMRSLVRIRPQYRAAQSLLLEWAGGEA